QERLIVWTLLDTGFRVSELAGITREHIDWQNHRLMIYGKGGPYGTKSKRRILPLTDRIRPLIDGHFAIHDSIGNDTPHHSTHPEAHRQQSPHQPPCDPACAQTHLYRCSGAEGHLPPWGSCSRRTKNNDPYFHGRGEEQNEGLRPRILWTETPC